MSALGCWKVVFLTLLWLGCAGFNAWTVVYLLVRFARGEASRRDGMVGQFAAALVPVALFCAWLAWWMP